MSATSLTFDILARDRASQAFKNVGQASDGLHGKFTKLGGAATTLAKGALLGGVGAAVAGVGIVLKTGIGEVSDYQRGFAQLTQGLKTTHNAAGVTAKQMENLASSIQGYSGQTDDSVVAAEQLLLTFTNIRNEAGKNNDVFTQTTKIAADMAARMGGDASTQAIRLGKALNDPVKGITALTKVGVSFDEGQKKQIKTLVAHGKTVQAQKVILAELNKEFGGSAKAVGNTLPGMIDKAKRHFEDFSQGLVTKMLPTLTNVAHFIGDKVMPAVQTLVSEGFAQLMPVIQTVSGVISDHLVPAFQAVAGFVQANILPILKAVAEFIIGKLYPAIAKILGGALDGLRKAFQHISETVAAHRAQLQTLGNFIRKVAEIAVKILAPVLSVVLKTAFRILGTAISLIITIIGDLISAVTAVVHFFRGPFVRAIGALVSMAVKGFKFIADVWLTVVGTILDAAAKMFGWVPGIGGKLKHAAAAFDTFKTAVDAKLSGIADDASKWGKDIGTDLGGGLIAGLNAQIPHATTAGKLLVQTTAKQMRLAADAHSPSRVTAQLGRDMGQGLIDGLKSKLAALKQTAQQLASSVASTIVSNAALTNTPNQTVRGITSFLRHQLTIDRAFQRNLRTLARKGYSKDLIAEIAQEGPEAAGNLAQQLAGASRAQVARINRLETGIGRTATATGRQAKQEVYSAQLDKLNRQIADLNHTVHAFASEVHGAQHRAKARA